MQLVSNIFPKRLDIYPFLFQHFHDTRYTPTLPVKMRNKPEVDMIGPVIKAVLIIFHNLDYSLQFRNNAKI